MYSYMKIYYIIYNLLSHIHHSYVLYTGKNKNWYQKQPIYLQKGKPKSYTIDHTD